MSGAGALDDGVVCADRLAEHLSRIAQADNVATLDTPLYTMSGREEPGAVEAGSGYPCPKELGAEQPGLRLVSASGGRSRRADAQVAFS